MKKKKSEEKIADIDRRYNPRLVKPNLKAKVQEQIVQIDNISPAGICFSSDKNFDSPIYISIEFPSKKVQLDIEAKWMKSDSNGNSVFGASFNGKNREISNIVEKYLVSKHFQIVVKNIKDKYIRKNVKDFAKQLRNYLFKLSDLQSAIVSKEENAHVQSQLNILNDDIVQKGEELRGRINNKLVINKIKNEFRSLVSCWAYKSKIMKRGFDKPKGYPGDFRTLEIIYDFETFSEPDDLGFYFDNYFLYNPYATAVRNRKNILREILKDFLTNEQKETKVLNLASGSCREIRELFQDVNNRDLLKKKILFSCLDWDDDALLYSKKELSFLPKNIEIETLKEDVMMFTKNADFFKKSGNYNFIYSIGLADYLPDRVLKNMIKNSYAGLNTGGQFLIAHKDKNIGFSHLPPEWFCDWVFYPRNENDMLNLVKETGLIDKVGKVIRDETRQIFFISISKD